MPQYENLPASLDPDQMLELGAILRELSSEVAHLAEIPTVLAERLGLSDITLALVHMPAPARVLVAGSTATTPNAELERALADLARRGASEQSIAEDDVLRPFAGSTAVVHDVGAQHRLLVVLHNPAADATLDLGRLVAAFLAKSTHATLGWQSSPATLGDPFDRLTEREWIVLLALNSDDGEKQLADRLHLSPHTLHSHIKSIYRKMGVQGRLPLLQRLHAATRQYSIRQLATPS